MLSLLPPPPPSSSSSSSSSSPWSAVGWYRFEERVALQDQLFAVRVETLARSSSVCHVTCKLLQISFGFRPVFVRQARLLVQAKFTQIGRRRRAFSRRCALPISFFPEHPFLPARRELVHATACSQLLSLRSPVFFSRSLSLFSELPFDSLSFLSIRFSLHHPHLCASLHPSTFFRRRRRRRKCVRARARVHRFSVALRFVLASPVSVYRENSRRSFVGNFRAKSSVKRKDGTD